MKASKYFQPVICGIWFSFLFLLPAQNVSAQDGWGRLQNFEDGDLSRWQLEGPGTMALDSTYATQLERNLRVEFGQGSSLRVSLKGIWRMEEIIREKFSDEGGGGWKIYEAFFTDIYAPEPVGLLFTFNDSLGGEWQELRTMKKGLNLVQWRREALVGVDFNSLVSVSYAPAQACRLYIDHVRTWEYQPELDQRGKMDIVYSDSVVSPHIAWQRPDAGGPIRGLFTPRGSSGRVMVELMQRFDIQPTTVTFEPSLGLHRWAFGDFYGTRALAYDHVTTKFTISYTDLTSELESDKPFDVIVLQPMRGWQNWPPELRRALLERVKAGCGLVLFQPTAVEDGKDFWELSPLKGEVKIEKVKLRKTDQAEERPGGITRDVWKSTDKEHYITRGVPLDLIPTADIEYLAYSADGAEVLIETDDGSPILATGTYGKGRVAAFAWVDEGMFPSVVNPLDEKSGLPYWEYIYALTGRTVRWAAGRELKTGIYEPFAGKAASDGPAVVSASIAYEPGDRIRCVLRNQDWQTVSDTIIELTSSKLKMLYPDLPLFSRMTADIWLLRQGRTVDFASVSSGFYGWNRIDSLITDRETYNLGEIVTGKVRIEKNGRPAKVAVTLTDNRDRLLGADTLELEKGGEGKFSFSTAGCLARRAVVTARVLSGNGEPVHSASAALFIDRPAAWDDYEVMMYRFMPNIIAGEWQFLDRYMEKLGVTAWAAVGPEFVYRSNLNIQSETRLDSEESLDGAGEIPYRQAKKNYLATRDKKYLHRLHCLHDPVYLSEQKRVLSEVIEPFKKFSPLSYYCYEEPSFTHYGDAFDLCFSPYTLAALRLWLKEQYGSLAAVNRQWGTNFKAWESVIPDDTFEAQERGNYSSWADHRAFMDISYAENYGYVRSVVRSLDSDGLVMMTGTQRTVPHNGYDYYLLDQTIDHTQPYGEPARHKAFIRQGGKITGCTGYGVFGPKLDYELWSRLFSGHTAGSAIFWQFSTIDPDYRLCKSGADMVAIFDELRHRGIARLVASADWTRSEIVILWSMPSIRGTWIQDGRIIEADGAPSEMFERWEFNYESWRWLLDDLGVPYRVMSFQMLENGWLENSGARILVLPNTIALSEEGVRRIESFASGGGVVVGDAQTAQMDGHCKWLEKGNLDRLFGIRGAQIAPIPAELHITQHGGTWGLKTADEKIKAAGSEKSDFGPGFPPVFHKKSSQGECYYLNTFLSGYGRLRQQGRGSAVRSAAGKLLQSAGYKPLIQLKPASGSDLRGARMVSYNLGEAGFLVGLIKDYRVAEPARDIEVVMPQDGFHYDVRQGRYLGHGSKIRTSLATGEIKLLASLPCQVEGLRLDLPGNAGRGEQVSFSFQITSDSRKAAGPHVFVVEVLNPQGEKVSYYGNNVVGQDGAAQSSFYLALNDTPGRWRVRVRDVASGVSTESYLMVE